MSDFASKLFPDVPTCVDCRRRLDGLKYGAGAFQCWDCAAGRFPDLTEPSLKEKLAAVYGPKERDAA